MRSLRKSFVVLLSAALIFSSSALVFADESLEDKLDNLQNQATEQQKKTDAAQVRINTISEQLREIQDEVDTATSAYKEVKASLDDVQARMDDNQQTMEKTEKELAVKTKLLDKRVRDIYINGQLSYIDVLFGARDFSDFMTRMDLLKRIIQYDYNLVMKVQQDKAVIAAARIQLEQDKESAAALVREADDKKKAVQLKKQKQDRLLAKVKNDKDTSERAYEEIRAASRQVENLIRMSRYQVAAPGGGGSGMMIWPISGEITSEFGWRVHPIFGTGRFHSGLDIAGDYGMPIRAAAAGTVIYAGWISGYGNAVIIDHGGGITSLYGHNESLNVSEGQSVAQGQVIAYCGSTGNSTGPHCHFEVRKDGEPVSPYGYL